MRTRIALLALAASASAHAAVAPEAALSAYSNGYSDYPLSHPRISPEGRLILEAGPEFVTNVKERSNFASAACVHWVHAMRSSGAQVDPSLVILTPTGGSLWECGETTATPIQDWDDTQAPYTAATNMVGNLFMSFSGQASLGGPTTTYGFQFAEGVILLNRRFTFAFTTGIVNTNTAISMGLLLQYRPPITSTFGLLVGVHPTFQVAFLDAPAGSTLSPSMQTSFGVGFQGGFTINVPTGTVDLTGEIENTGAYTAFLGHTFFFNVR